MLAQGAHYSASRFGLLSRPADGLVRAEPSRLRVGLGPQLAAAAQDCACDAGGKTATPANGSSGTGVCRFSLPHAQELEPSAARGGQSRVSGERREPPFPGDLLAARVVGSRGTI